MEGFVANLPFSDDERNDLTVIVDALTKKNTIRGRAALLSDSIGHILEATSQGNADKALRPDCYLPGFQPPVQQFRKRYLTSMDEISERFSPRAQLYGCNNALTPLREIRASSKKRISVISG